MSTIAAISTALGIGGIGIVRVSGEDTFKIVDKIFKPKKGYNIDEIKGYTIKYGYIVDNETIVDEVLVSFFKGPNSYTTENLCEISSHGGTYVVRKILETCLKNGAVLAEPGEFTKRAFLNGRLDLSQAEAVIDIINSKTEKEARSSMNQLEGILSKKIKKIRDILMSLMVEIEVFVDYPEYDVEAVENKKVYNELINAENELKKLENSFECGRIIKEGIKVALIGKPNAGKSSLLNTILNEERAIVTDIEGTTRDTIEEAITIKGIPINIIDTAGIREAANTVERIGIEKSKKLIKESDLVIAIFDGSQNITKEDKEILSDIKNTESLVILNKVDINRNEQIEEEVKKILSNPEIIWISAKENIGIEEIYEKIEQKFKLDEINIDNSIIVTNIRHKEIIKKAIKDTQKAIEHINKNLPIDMVAFFIKDILEDLGEITGETVTDEIIKEIFSRFCLGK